MVNDNDGLDIVDAGVDDVPLALASDEPSDDLVAVLREILSTVVRPTGARPASVTRPCPVDQTSPAGVSPVVERIGLVE